MPSVDFPVTMKHPQHMPAVLSEADGIDLAARPERFPDVIVHDERQEEMYRARGYLRFGESVPVYDAHLEYPKILQHELYEEAVPPRQDAVVQADGRVVFVAVPGVPAKYPHKTVNSRQEEEEWGEKGWFPPGHFDPAAYERAVDAPGEAGDEYPRAVYDDTGKFIGVQEDPDAPVDTSKIYPMAIYDGDTFLGVAANAVEATKLRARGSSKNEPVKRTVESSYDAEYAEFLEWKRWKAERKQVAVRSSEPHEVRPEDRAPMVAEPPEDSLSRLRQEAQELGVNVDLRWGERRLQREIDVALSR